MRTNASMEKMPYPAPDTGRMARAKDQLASDFGTLLSDAEDLLRSTATYSGDAVNSARDKLKGTLDHVKGRVTDAHRVVAGKFDAAASATDTYVHDNPWKLAGVAAAVGFVIGVLLLSRK